MASGFCADHEKMMHTTEQILQVLQGDPSDRNDTGIKGCVQDIQKRVSALETRNKAIDKTLWTAAGKAALVIANLVFMAIVGALGYKEFIR